MRRQLALAVGAALALPLALIAAPATAAPAPPPPKVLHEDLFSPLKLAHDLDGSVYVTDNFAGSLHKIARGGKFSTLYTTATPGNEVGAVSAFLGSVYFAETTADGALLKKVDRKGRITQLADLGAHEKAKNPDGKSSYGFSDLSADCLAQVPEGIPASYTGEVYSHPYATLGTPLGTVVADAGGNALLTVSSRGTVRTLAVLPPQRAIIGEWALELGLPECSLGHPYDFEPVPTDVELGPDGWLYVSLLPGGPETPAAGARGSVVKVNPLTGKLVTVATGLVSASDLAVSPRGDIYVTELFSGRIAVIKKGTKTAVTFREAALPAAVEWAPKGLYATVDAVPAFGPPETPPPPPAGDVVFFRF
ncbi:ScyD/ScyE family protein [Microbacterium terricola]|uniref:ScyD/ScyE family protein n=1 Tax=Microbacterium terricola TaxID=344163 RepID=A0ABM8DWA9_9MICO|nr:ScyD/ScyE family protein [Microbacterium terricola]UYK39334.1 ScyD/ScyE family protein [Microbacterium terricola]BDV29943.1 hypothetical protein Microterr_06030 [Microbacterium terricola]